MTQDEFVSLLRQQAGAPEADSLAEKTLITAWRMSQAGDSESVKNAENILNFATVEPAIKNLVKQQFGQVAPSPTASVEKPHGAAPESIVPIENVDDEVSVIPAEAGNQKSVELDSLLQGNDGQLANVEPQTISIPSTPENETDSRLSLPEPEVLVEKILSQSTITTPVTQTQKNETPDDLVSRVLNNTENRKLSRSEEFEQLISKTKQEEIKKEVELEKPPVIIHTYDTTYEDEAKTKTHSIEDRIKADKAQPFFARCEEYMKKAYQNGSSSIITSAENQFESLKKRFPEFVELYSDRISAMELMKTDQASQELVSIEVSGIEVKKGMTITSSHVYEVNKILKQGSTVMFHFSDETSRNYKLSSDDLARGLETPGIDADVFFDEFRVN